MNWGRLYFGSVIVAVGVILLLDNAGTVDAGDIFGTWWPALVVAAGLLMLAANPGHWVMPLLVTAVGVALLLSTLDVVDIGDFLWPAILVAVGLVVIFGRSVGGRSTDTGSTVSNFTVFSGSELASHSDSFEGGSVSAVFGGVELDLRDAQLAPEAALDVFTAFGGVDISVPQGWHVEIKGFPIFGGFENATTKDKLSSASPTLTINATVMFGGLEVKH